MEVEEKNTSNGEKKQFTLQEVLADIYARLDLYRETQIRLNTMLQAWYVKLDIYSRASQKLAEAVGLPTEKFKELVDTSLKEMAEEHEKMKTLEAQTTEEPLILDPNMN